MEGVAFLRALTPGATAYLYIYALQQPEFVSFLKLRYIEQIFPDTTDMTPEDRMQLWDTWCPHKFDYQDYDFVSGKDLDLDTVEMLALENVYFVDIGFLHCNQDPVPWDEFLEGLPEQKPQKPSSRKSATGKRIADEDLVQFPWLLQYLKKSLSDKPSSSSTHGSTS